MGRPVSDGVIVSIFKWACTSLWRRGRTVGDRRLKTYIVGGIEILKMAWMSFDFSSVKISETLVVWPVARGPWSERATKNYVLSHVLSGWQCTVGNRLDVHRLTHSRNCSRSYTHKRPHGGCAIFLKRCFWESNEDLMFTHIKTRLVSRDYHWFSALGGC